MDTAKCPACGCRNFYVKNPEDEFEIHVFTCENGEVCFDEEINESASPPPPIEDETETFCNSCAWHDRFQKVKIEFK